jgi:hypothetical protein
VNGSVVLWSFGNYKVGRFGRAGVNNASLYQQFFQRDICDYSGARGKDRPALNIGQPCSVWWVSTHYRMRAYFEDEKPEVVRQYNEEMRRFFEAGQCGPVNFVDVYNMTASLATLHTSDAEKMTYDGVHWGMEVNLVKAQIIINALVSSSLASQ